MEFVSLFLRPGEGARADLVGPSFPHDGTEMAADLPLLFPGAGKKVTLVHSRENLMPRFHTDIHKVIVKRLGELGVETLLGSRAKIPQGGWDAIKNGGKLELEDGRSVEGDLIVCP